MLTTDYMLIKRAVRLFPKRDYCDPATVKANRRKWVQAVVYLRQNALWALDVKQPKRVLT